MRHSLIPSLLLVVLTALAFWPAHSASFLLYDDPLHVTNNPYYQPPTLTRLAYFWRYPFNRTPVPGIASSIGQVRPPYQEIYSPLAFTTWGLLVYPAHLSAPPEAVGSNKKSGQPDDFSSESDAYPLNPAIYHSFNLVLHGLNVLLVFALLRRFVKQDWAAALGAALFALHPVQVEPVAWVTGMNNLLSGFFALLALLLFLAGKDEGDGPRWRVGAYWGGTFCFLLSVLSKPSSVTLPVLALLLCWGLGEKKWRSRLLEMVPWGAIVLFCVGTNALVTHGIDYGLKPMTWQKPFLIGDALTFYGAKLLFPWHLAPDYGRRPEWVMAQPLTYGIWLLPVGLCLLAWFWWKRSLARGQEDEVARIALVGLAIFAVVLLPTSGIVTYYFHRISTVSDRYMYMAIIGPAIWVAVIASRCAESKNASHRRFLVALSAALVAVLGGLSFRQTKFWQSDLPLWSHNVAVVPQSTVAYYQYGVGLYNGHDYKAAVPVLEQGLKAAPDSWLTEIALANAYFQVNEPAKAEIHYRQALAIWPNAVDAHSGLGVLQAQQGKLAEAVEQFRQGLQLQPENPQLLAYMGLNLTEAGQSAQSVVYLQNALKNGFDPAKGHFYLGNALAATGNIADAAKEWSVATQLDPLNYEALYDLGIVNARVGDMVQAQQFFERSAGVQPNYAPAQIQLGLLWQKQGQKEKARAAFGAALRLDPHNALAVKALSQIK